MSNVKVNGNTYNDVTSVKLPLADGTGYATYAEGAIVSDELTNLLTGNVTDFTFEANGDVYVNAFSGLANANVNLPNATKLYGSCIGGGGSLIAPKVAELVKRGSNYPQYAGKWNVLDLSGLASSVGSYNQMFMGGTFTTLKCGSVKAHNGAMQNATITNLVWTLPAVSAYTTPMNQTTSVTNLYVPDELADGVRELVTDGTITKVTNVYGISEWSDD